MKEIKINEKIFFSNEHPFVLIAGPCVIESEKNILETAEKLVEITSELNIPFIFKSSFDKANRSSISSYRGPGIKKGLEILEKVKNNFNVSILTDVHKEEEVCMAAEIVDILQVPAFLSRQTDLLSAVAKTGKAVNIKKAQFMAPWDIKNCIGKIEAFDNKNILLTERGFCFGYNRWVVDMCSIYEMKKTGYPVIIDVTHSIQEPGGAGDHSGGQKEYIPVIAKSALALGLAGIFIETHIEPDFALSDGKNMLKLSEMKSLLKKLKAIDGVVKNGK